jgi:hypothetical protein
MGFLGIYRAVYDYTPQGEGELAISEGDILYVLEKSGEDDWWKAKKKASGDDDDEPVGLIPSNYIEEVRPTMAHRLQHISVKILEEIHKAVLSPSQRCVFRDNVSMILHTLSTNTSILQRPIIAT